MVRRHIAIAVAALLGLPAGHAAADYNFTWAGKIEIDAEGLGSTDPERRLDAVNTLGRYAAGATTPYLMKALRDPDPRVAHAAARILGKNEVAEAAPVIIDWLDDPDVAIKEVAVQVLGDLATDEATTALIRTLGDIDDRVRREAVIALGKIGTPAVVVPLISRLEDDKSEVRLAAVEQLQSLGDRRAVIPLVAAFKDPAVSVRKAAVAAVGHLDDQTSVPALLRLLRDSDEEIKVAAVTSLGNLAAEAATDELIEQLDHGEGLLRAKAAYALGQVAKEAAKEAAKGAAGGASQTAGPSRAAGRAASRAVRALVRALAVRPLRSGATEALRNAGAIAVPALIAHVEGELDGDLQAAIALIRDIGDPRATPALVAELDRGRVSHALLLDAIAAAGDNRALIPVLGLLSATDAAIRRKAMTALRPLIRDRRAADVLIELLADSDLEIQILAAEYLGLMRARRAVPRLMELAGPGAEPRLRLASVDALGEIADARATPALLALLADGPRALHHAAASALIYIADPAAIKPLVSLAGDGKADARDDAVRALGGVLRRPRRPDGGPGVGSPGDRAAARRTLEGLAQQASLPLSLAAIEALAAIGDPASAPALVELASNADTHRRRAALSALGDVGTPADAGDDPSGVVRALIDGLQSGDDRVSADAAWALGKRGGPEAVAALVRATRRRGWATAINVSAALARAAGRGDADALIPLLYHRDRLVRVNAAMGLGRVRAAKARGPLSVLLAGDPSPAVRLAAARALGQLRAGGRSAADARKALAEASERERREAVREAIAAALAGPFRPPARVDWRNFHFVEPDRDDAPVRQEPYFVIAADGLVTALYTDDRGRAGEEQFPPGDYAIAPKSRASQH